MQHRSVNFGSPSQCQLQSLNNYQSFFSSSELLFLLQLHLLYYFYQMESYIFALSFCSDLSLARLDAFQVAKVFRSLVWMNKCCLVLRLQVTDQGIFLRLRNILLFCAAVLLSQFRQSSSFAKISQSSSKHSFYLFFL